jgi:signal transduction histidine kinase
MFHAASSAMPRGRRAVPPICADGALVLASGAGLLGIVNILARSWRWHGLNVNNPVSVMVAESAIALGIMAIVSIALGWLVAGHVLRPLQAMTATTRAISEDNLDARLAVPGPRDELKGLGDTIDDLLARLQAAFDTQRQFAASASHELRTPLTVTRTLLQMVLTDPHPTLAGYRSVCEDVLEAGERQEQLIEALLTLARSQRGLNRRDRLDLAAITRQTLDARQAETTARGLAVTTSTGLAAPVAGDARLLERLTANLVDNAIRYNSPGGQIPRLLQPFQRQPATRSVGQDGLGLGLAIVAAIAKAHHATLTISPGPHGGLNVAITFPSPSGGATTRQAALAAA